MTALEVPQSRPLSAPPSFGQTLGALFAKEARQNAPILGFVLLGIFLLQLLIAWRGAGVPLGSGVTDTSVTARVPLAALLTTIPLFWALFKGFWQVRSEYAQHTQTLLRSLPASGFAVLLAKYLWLWVEVVLLSLLTLGGLLLFAGLDTGFGQLTTYQANGQSLSLDARFWTELGKVTLLSAFALAPLPAVAMCATTLGRLVPRADLLVNFVAYIGLLVLGSYLLNGLFQLHLNWPGVTVGSSFSSEVAVPTLHGEFLVLSLVFTGLLLWLAGTLFERQDA